MPYDKDIATTLTLDERVEKSINDLTAMSFDGCIAGSCLLPESFNEWESEPDVDFFAYSEVSWLYTVASLVNKDRYVPATKKDAWKITRISQGKHRSRNRYITQTIYLKDTEADIYINASYKPGTSNVLDVLSRFDTIAIMIGLCCRTKALVDLRAAFYPQDAELPIMTQGHANPIRLWYMVEGWDEETWTRELSRIKKYESRGYNMEGMARSLLGVASQVLEKGETVGSEKSKVRYLGLMVSCYRPIRWLENFINGEDSLNDDLSAPIFQEILSLIEDLPTTTQEELLSGLAEPLLAEGSKIFMPDEDEVTPYENPDDR